MNYGYPMIYGVCTQHNQCSRHSEDNMLIFMRQKQPEWNEFIDCMTQYMEETDKFEREAVYYMWKDEFKRERLDHVTLEEISKL